MFTVEFFIRNTMLGVGLAMDACAVSMANGFNEPKMRLLKVFVIALFYAVFQAIMPLIGYFIGNALLSVIERFIPWIALVLLLFLGGKTLIEGIKKKGGDMKGGKTLTLWALAVQAVATSIDALSVGFTFAEYDLSAAIIAAAIIAAVTFALTFLSVIIGKKFGTVLGNKAEILGGIILIAIGVEIFITGII